MTLLGCLQRGMSDVWHLAKDGKQFGPFSLAELRTRCALLVFIFSRRMSECRSIPSAAAVLLYQIAVFGFLTIQVNAALPDQGLELSDTKAIIAVAINMLLRSSLRPPPFLQFGCCGNSAAPACGYDRCRIIVGD